MGYASDETEDCMPLTHSMATRLGKTLTDVRKSGECWWLRPDGKTQVTIEYQQKADGSVEPTKIHTVVISTQHAEPLKATRKKEVEGYDGADETAPSMEEMNKLIIEKVVKRTLSEIILKNGKPALTLYGDHTHNYINPSGKDNMVMVAGEITTQAKLDYDKVVRDAVKGIGYDTYEDDLGSVDSKGLSYKSCEVLVRINKQSPDIAGGVHVGKEEMDVGAGDQGIMFGYASDETEDCMPLTHSMATRLGKTLTDVRKSGECWWLRPDGKTQVTIEYLQREDGSVEPKKIHTVVISTQHAEPLKAVRS